MHKLTGTLWVDDKARQVVRLEAHLSDAFIADCRLPIENVGWRGTKLCARRIPNA